MKQIDAIDVFSKMDHVHGRRVFTGGDMRKLFPQDSERALVEGMMTLVKNKILERPARGIYVYAKSTRPRTHLLYEVARTLRRGHHTYLSFESALSEYGAISQVPFSTTFMTTGRRGIFETKYGTIEFSHTDRHPSEFVGDLIDNGRPLPIASFERALSDLIRINRNTHLLIDIEEIRQEQKDRAAERSAEAEEDINAEFF